MKGLMIGVLVMGMTAGAWEETCGADGALDWIAPRPKLVQSVSGGSSTSTAPATAPKGPTVPTVTLELKGRAIEKPVMAYSLMYRIEETTKGNAAVKYLQATTDLANYHKLTNEEVEALDAMKTVELSKLDESAAKKFMIVQSACDLSGAFAKARDGSKMESYDPELQAREKGYRALLPSLSQYRHIVNMLTIATRIDIKHHRWGEAREKIAMGYGMARHMAHGETVIEELVGTAMASSMTKTLEDWVSEGGPNLYWDLVNLPRPFVDMQRGLWMERGTATLSFRSYREMKAGHYSAENWASIARDSIGILAFTEDEKDYPVMLRKENLPVAGALMGTLYYPQAKAFLMQRGMTAAELEKMPVAEVLGRWFVRSYEEMSDEMFKGFGLPLPEALATTGNAEKELVQSDNWLARNMLPSLSRVMVLAARADRQVDMMRVVEGVRAYVAEKGALPEKLEDAGLPMPLDVMTGKAFEYVKEGETARLVSPVPGKDVRSGAVVVMTLRK